MNTHSDIQDAEQAPKRDKGFTLVELLIVIVILGVLSTVTVFAVSGITGRGEAARCDSDERTVAVAVEAYYAQESDYPADPDGAGPLTAMDELTPDYLRDASTLHTVGDGNGVVTGVGDCA
jgi:prepilin-type N-terminal cleavage/methylation domain-containing protein